MASVISATSGSSHLLRDLRRNNDGVNRALERLMTGKRINRPSDDPSGFVGAEELRSEIVRLQAEVKSVRRIRGAVREQESTLGNLQQQLNDLRGLLSGSAGNVLSEEVRKAYDKQIGESLASIERLRSQLADRGPTGIPQVDATTPAALAGDQNQLAETIDSRVDAAIFSRAALAAFEKYDLEVRETLYENMLVTHTEALSQLEDADFAEEAANLATSQTLAAGSLAAIAYAGKLQAEQVGTLIEGLEAPTLSELSDSVEI